jgi:hypothetical protein
VAQIAETKLTELALLMAPSQARLRKLLCRGGIPRPAERPDRRGFTEVAEFWTTFR